MITQYLVTLTDDDPPNADQVRDCLLDAWGYPTGIEEKPELLKVAALIPDDLRIIVIALRKAAYTSHPDMAARERDLAYRITKLLFPPLPLPLTSEEDEGEL